MIAYLPSIMNRVSFLAKFIRSSIRNSRLVSRRVPCITPPLSLASRARFLSSCGVTGRNFDLERKSPIELGRDQGCRSVTDPENKSRDFTGARNEDDTRLQGESSEILR